MTLYTHGHNTTGPGNSGFTSSVFCRVRESYNFLVFSSLLLSFECVAMVVVSCMIQQIRLNCLIATIPFIAAFSIYNLNRKTDEAEDAINHKERFAFTKKYEAHLFRLAGLALILAIVLAAPAGIPSLLVTAAPFLCGFLYSFRILPETFRYRRLKEIPGIKNCVVGFAWGILLSLLPVFLSGGVADSRTSVTFILFFLWGFMASLIPDIRDREGDAASGVISLPVILGVARTRSLLTGIILVLGAPLIVFSTLYLPFSTTVLILAALVYSLICTQMVEDQNRIDFLADCISDGQYIPFALLFALIPLLGGLSGIGI